MSDVTIENMPSPDEYNAAAKEVITFALMSGEAELTRNIKTMMDYTEGLNLAFNAVMERVVKAGEK